MVIEDIELTYVQARSRVVEIDLDRVRIDANHPEHVVHIDVHIVIVDLVRKTGRSSRIGVDVQSNKGERAVVMAAVRANELAFAESHVCLVRHGRANAG